MTLYRECYFLNCTKLLANKVTFVDFRRAIAPNASRCPWVGVADIRYFVNRNYSQSLTFAICNYYVTFRIQLGALKMLRPGKMSPLSSPWLRH